MTYSYEGIGQVAATFKGTDVKVGDVVKISGTGKVTACAAGDDFCGVVVSVARDGKACTVALKGMVTLPFGDSAPALGWSGIGASGTGGVNANSGCRSYLVVSLSALEGTVTFML